MKGFCRAFPAKTGSRASWSIRNTGPSNWTMRQAGSGRRQRCHRRDSGAGNGRRLHISPCCSARRLHRFSAGARRSLSTVSHVLPKSLVTASRAASSGCSEVSTWPVDAGLKDARIVLGQVRKQLGDIVDMKHFTPTYMPWDQSASACAGCRPFRKAHRARPGRHRSYRHLYRDRPLPAILAGA